MTPKTIMGIDPGTSNLGWAIIFPKEHNERPLTGVMDSSRVDVSGVQLSVLKAKDQDKFKGLVSVADTLVTHAAFSKVEKVVIERFVSYEGRMTSLQEDMNIFIGLISGKMLEQGIEVVLTRAEDWKVTLTHHLIKKGWRNPGQGRDKDFSFAVCKEMTGMVPATSHEADALCLAALGGIQC